MFLGLPDPDPLVRDTDPDPDPSIIKKKNNSKKNIDSYCFVTLRLYDFLSLKNDLYVSSKSTGNKQKNFFFGVLKVTDENSRIRIH
jgi:hypothetical protein